MNRLNRIGSPCRVVHIVGNRRIRSVRAENVLKLDVGNCARTRHIALDRAEIEVVDKTHADESLGAVDVDIFERNIVEIGTVERANVHSTALTEFVVIPTVVVVEEHIAVVKTNIGVVAVCFCT